MVKKRRSNTQALCCPSHTRLMNCYRRTSAISGKLFEHHGSGEVIVFRNQYIPFFPFPSLLLDPLIMWEWLFDCMVTGRKVDK
jgi:hypothetical protein